MKTGHKQVVQFFQGVFRFFRKTVHNPNQCFKVTKEDASLMISDQAGQVADTKSE